MSVRRGVSHYMPGAVFGRGASSEVGEMHIPRKRLVLGTDRVCRCNWTIRVPPGPGLPKGRPRARARVAVKRTISS